MAFLFINLITSYAVSAFNYLVLPDALYQCRSRGGIAFAKSFWEVRFVAAHLNGLDQPHLGPPPLPTRPYFSSALALQPLPKLCLGVLLSSSATASCRWVDPDLQADHLSLTAAHQWRCLMLWAAPWLEKPLPFQSPWLFSMCPSPQAAAWLPDINCFIFCREQNTCRKMEAVWFCSSTEQMC